MVLADHPAEGPDAQTGVDRIELPFVGIVTGEVQILYRERDTVPAEIGIGCFEMGFDVGSEGGADRTGYPGIYLQGAVSPYLPEGCDLISGQQVARFLDQLGDSRGLPPMIVRDNGPEFTSKAMFFWAKECKTKLGLIQPGKPTKSAFVESLSGKLRNEYLNQHWLRSPDQACWEIEQCRKHYNHIRPHSALGYLPPVEFAKQAA